MWDLENDGEFGTIIYEDVNSATQPDGTTVQVMTNYVAPFDETGDDPTGWTISGEDDIDNLVEVDGDGNFRLLSDGTFVSASQIVTDVGKAYLATIIVESVIGGEAVMMGTGGIAIPGSPDDLDAAGTFPHYFIADSTTFGVKRKAAACDIAFSQISLVEINEFPGEIGGTTSQGLAGKRGENARVLGADIVVNGGFDTDSDWVTEAGWTISGGTATYGTGTGSSLLQTNILTVGQSYHVTFDVIGRTAGTLQMKLGGGTLLTVDSDGSYVVDAPADGINLFFFADSPFNGSVDNVTAQLYTTPSALLVDGVTSLITIPENADIYDQDNFNVFIVVNLFGYGGSGAGRVIELNNDIALSFNATGIGVFVNYVTVDISETLTEQGAVPLNEWASAGFRLDSSDDKMIGFVNGIATEKSAAGTGGKSNAAADLILFNRAAGGRGMDGVPDLVAVISGAALSDHTYKRLHDFIFRYLN